MLKDPTEFRERFRRWKEGEQVYENGLALPAYESGKTPMLDRLEYDSDGSKVLEWEKEFLDKYYSPSEQKRLKLSPEKEALYRMEHSNTAAFNAGTLPGVVIKPPKDSKKVLAMAKEMLPIDKMRQKLYEHIENERDMKYPYKDIDTHEYIRRMYKIYEASNKPSVSTTKVPEYTIFHNPFNIAGKDRAMYDAILNRMYLDPENPRFISELSHAFHVNTSIPDDGFSLPGDIKIKGKSGYHRPGHNEYTAHRIIQPILNQYFEDQDTDFPIDDMIKTITDIHDNPKEWGYPTREEVMSSKSSGTVIGPKKGHNLLKHPVLTHETRSQR